MDPRTRVLTVDFSLAAAATSVGTVGTAGPLLWTVAIAGFGAVVLAGCLYLAEQTPLLDVVDRHSPRSYVAAFALTLAVGLVLVLGWAVVASPAAALLLGMGLGLAGYRTQYGLREAIPEKRLEQTGESAAFELDPPTGQS
jgi:predicted PurR-regulated permease PerM